MHHNAARMPSIGDTLREARMRQRLDIADVERKTKIRAKYLRALENEEFAMLPGPTFVKTFLRTYAEVLGLDPHVLVEEYRATYESRDDMELQPLGPPAVGRDRRRGPRAPGPLLLVALGVAVVIGALLVIGLVGDEGDGEGRQAADQTETQTQAETTPQRETPQRPRRVALRIAPVTETYICIDTGEGTETRFEGIITEPQTFRGRRLRVNFGNTSVEVTKNGEPVAIEPSTEPVGFLFTPRASRALPLGERPCA
jgi:cytoskeleton protein RodZ